MINPCDELNAGLKLSENAPLRTFYTGKWAVIKKNSSPKVDVPIF